MRSLLGVPCSISGSDGASRRLCRGWTSSQRRRLCRGWTNGRRRDSSGHREPLLVLGRLPLAGGGGHRRRRWRSGAVLPHPALPGTRRQHRPRSPGAASRRLHREAGHVWMEDLRLRLLPEPSNGGIAWHARAASCCRVERLMLKPPVSLGMSWVSFPRVRARLEILNGSDVRRNVHRNIPMTIIHNRARRLAAPSRWWRRAAPLPAAGQPRKVERGHARARPTRRILARCTWGSCFGVRRGARGVSRNGSPADDCARPVVEAIQQRLTSTIRT